MLFHNFKKTIVLNNRSFFITHQHCNTPSWVFIMLYRLTVVCFIFLKIKFQVSPQNFHARLFWTVCGSVVLLKCDTL